MRIPERTERGFSLIELGIVIAVIAILAVVIVFGRGFISGSRITQAVNAANTVRNGAASYAGLIGGSLPPTGTGAGNDIPTLGNRGLLAVSAAPWFVSGSAANPTDSVQISSVNLGTAASAAAASVNQNAVAVSYTMPTPAMAQDLYMSVVTDSNFVATGGTIGTAPSPCANAMPVGPNVTVCFYL